MGFSFYAIHRIAEKKKDMLKGKERVSISDGRGLADEELVKKLGTFDIEMNRDIFQQMVSDFLSAEEMFYHYFEQERVKVGHGANEDWLWICLLVLWERWAPEQPSFEMIDESMQDGYDRLDNEQVVEACEMWLKVWQWILKIMDKHDMKSIDDFDKKFRGTQSVWNWAQDLELELLNAGGEDPGFFRARIEFTGEYLKRFPYEDENVIQNMKRAFADSHFNLGEVKEAESLYEKYLKEDPTWGWGWIGYSDCYMMDWEKEPDFEKAEEILKRGLAVPRVEFREDIIGRLVEVYQESGRPEEAEKWIDKQPAPETKISKVKLVIPSKKKKKKKKKKG